MTSLAGKYECVTWCTWNFSRSSLLWLLTTTSPKRPYRRPPQWTHGHAPPRPPQTPKTPAMPPRPLLFPRTRYPHTIPLSSLIIPSTSRLSPSPSVVAVPRMLPRPRPRSRPRSMSTSAPSRACPDSMPRSSMTRMRTASSLSSLAAMAPGLTASGLVLERAPLLVKGIVALPYAALILLLKSLCQVPDTNRLAHVPFRPASAAAS